jgi:hypothetical protein
VHSGGCHHHQQHQGLDSLIRSVSRVTPANCQLANVSSVFQLFSFLVGCSYDFKGIRFSDILCKCKSQFRLYSSILCSMHSVCSSVVNGVRSRLFCGHKGCSLPEVSITLFLPLQFLVSVRVQFSDPYKNVGKTKVLCIFKIVFVLTFLKIVLLIVPINCKNFANLNSTSLENW